MGTSKQSFGFLFLVSILLSGNFFICRSLADGVTAEEARQLRDEVMAITAKEKKEPHDSFLVFEDLLS